MRSSNLHTDVGELPVSTSKSQRTILSEDGELRSIDAETDVEVAQPKAQGSAVYCTNCGSANHSSSHFCRACGQSLEEQAANATSVDTYLPPAWKAKRSAASGTQTVSMTPQDRALMIEVFTMLIMGALAVAGILTGQAWIALAVLLAWIVTQVIRRRKSDEE